MISSYIFFISNSRKLYNNCIYLHAAKLAQVSTVSRQCRMYKVGVTKRMTNRTAALVSSMQPRRTATWTWRESARLKASASAM